MLRIVLVAVAAGLGGLQSGSGMDETRLRLEAVRAAVSAPDRASRLAAFEHFRKVDEAIVLRTAIDAALRNDDGVLQAGGLRETFRLSAGFQVSLKVTTDTLAPGRKFVSDQPVIGLTYSDFDESAGTFRAGGSGIGGEGQLAGTLLTVGGGQDGCTLQVQLTEPWRMDGALWCRTMGRLDASIDLAGMPESAILGNTVVPSRIPITVRADNAQRRERVSDMLRAKSQATMQDRDLAIAMRKAGETGEAAVFSSWVKDSDPVRRRVAVREGLCHANPAVQSSALTAMLTNVESLPARHVPAGPGGDPAKPAGPLSLYAFGTRDYIVIRAAANGGLAAYQRGEPGTATVKGVEAAMDFRQGNSTCTYMLTPDCSGGPGRMPDRLTGSLQCRSGSKEPIDVTLGEVRWLQPSESLKTLVAQADTDARTLRELLDLLSRQDPAEQLGALEALAASANPIALDLALEASLTSQLAAARTLALPLILARSRLLLATADTTTQGANASGTFYGLLASGSNESLASFPQVRISFPGWTAHLQLQLGATRITAADDQFRLSLDVDASGELRGTLTSHDAKVKLPVRVALR